MGESPGSEDVRAQLPAALAEELVGKLQGLRVSRSYRVSRVLGLASLAVHLGIALAANHPSSQLTHPQ